MTLTVNIPNSLYHYTTKFGLIAIIESKVLYPSLDRGDGTDIKYGEGQYFTNISPDIIDCMSQSQMTSTQIESGQISLIQLAGRIMAGTLTLDRFYYFIELNVSELIIDQTDNPYTFIRKSKVDLDISNLIIRSGATLK